MAVLAAFFIGFFGFGGGKAAAAAADPENTIVMEIGDHDGKPKGKVVIEMRPDLAPNHVKRIKELVKSGFYNGVPFHRVIEGFMAQTGDPTGTGTGGSGKKLKAEFSSEPHVRGTVSMARASDPDSADSQFFICFAPSSFLNGQYTVWGKVTDGMDVVDTIKKGVAGSGQVTNPDKIISMKMAADVKK